MGSWPHTTLQSLWYSRKARKLCRFFKSAQEVTYGKPGAEGAYIHTYGIIFSHPKWAQGIQNRGYLALPPILDQVFGQVFLPIFFTAVVTWLNSICPVVKD